MDSVFWGKPNAWLFWCYCLMKATHTKRDVTIGKQTISLNPGQFIFGRKSAQLETGLTPQVIRSTIKMLIFNHQISVKSTNKYSIISVINWDIYQPDDLPVNQQKAKIQPTKSRNLTTIKNVYNKNENNLAKAASLLYDQKIFPEVHAFVNKMLKLRKHPI